jgi:hypothetical protein
MNYTLSYGQNVEGWVSFYSYNPDWMIGMNNFFYTFKGGNIYKHNVNSLRNNFYGTQYTSKLKSVINQEPLTNKLFKTISLEGDGTWSALLSTDLQYTGFIESPWFEKKEATWFAFIRNSGTVPAGTDEYPLRSLNGIGRSLNINIISTTTLIDFNTSPLVSIGSILSIGDYLYFLLPPYTTPVLAGVVTAINVDIPNGVNQIVINNSSGTPIPISDAYFLYIKSSVAESHGVLGHYCVFELENTSTSKVELFTLNSEVMKSYP